MMKMIRERDRTVGSRVRERDRTVRVREGEVCSFNQAERQTERQTDPSASKSLIRRRQQETTMLASSPLSDQSCTSHDPYSLL
jgi:hypothetical protein